MFFLSAGTSGLRDTIWGSCSVTYFLLAAVYYVTFMSAGSLESAEWGAPEVNPHRGALDAAFCVHGRFETVTQKCWTPPVDQKTEAVLLFGSNSSEICCVEKKKKSEQSPIPGQVDETATYFYLATHLKRAYQNRRVNTPQMTSSQLRQRNRISHQSQILS